MPDSFKVRAIKYHKPYQPRSTCALLCQPPASDSSSSSVSLPDSASAPSIASGPLASDAGAASGPFCMHIPGLAAIPSLTPTAAAAAGTGAGVFLDPARFFGAGDVRLRGEAGTGGGSVEEEAEACGQAQARGEALLRDDAAAAPRPSAQLDLLPTAAPRSSPALVPTAVAVALGAFPSSTFESLSPPLSPSMSLASSLSEEVMLGDRGGAGAGGSMGADLSGGQGQGQGQVDCGNGLRPPPWLPAVPVFDEAGMESIFE